MPRVAARSLIRGVGSTLFIVVLLLLPGMLLGSCTSGADPGPPIATEQQGMRLLRAVRATFSPTSPSPPIADLRERPAIKIALSEYAKSYPDATDAQFAFLRWWSSRYQDPDITGEMRDAATVIPLLLPEADDAALEQTLVDYPQLLFVYDPPMHQPDSDVLAVFLAKDPGLFKTIYNDSSQSIGAIQPVVVEQAMSRLLVAARDREEGSLPMGLRLVATTASGGDVGELERGWVELTLAHLRSEVAASTADGHISPRVLGQPFSTYGRFALLALFREIPMDDALRHHPAIEATLQATLETLLRIGPTSDSRRYDMAAWCDEVIRLYEFQLPDSNPAFRAVVERYLQESPKNWKEGT